MNDNTINSPVTITPTDGVAPILAEVTPVSTPTDDPTPAFTFSTTEAGTITYSGGCESDDKEAAKGGNEITFNELPDGTYDACAIAVTDTALNTSASLTLSSFVVDRTPVSLRNITNELGGLIIGDNPPFSPALEASIFRTNGAYYSILASSILPRTISDVRWKITVTGPPGLTGESFVLEEVGWEDVLNEPTVVTEKYEFECEDAEGRTVCVALGSQFDVDPNDSFKNIDKVSFAAFAPIGTYSIGRELVRAADGVTVSDTLDVASVSVENNLPVIEPIGPSFINELENFVFKVVVSDVEDGKNFFPESINSGSLFKFGLLDAPGGATINQDTGQLNWTPTEAQGPGTYTFKVTVADKDGGRAEGEMMVTVNEVNLPPQAEGADIETDEDTAVLITLSAEDEDIPANALTFGINTPPRSGQIERVSDNQVKYTPDENFNGTDSFVFKVGDGEAESTAVINITVKPVNDAPVLAEVSDMSVAAGTEAEFTVRASDVDEDNLAFSLEGAPAGSIINPVSGEFAWTPQIAGEYEFKVIVSDSLLTAEEIVKISVTHAVISKLALLAEPSTLEASGTSVIKVFGKDRFGNITTSDSQTIVILFADNGELGNLMVTLNAGGAQTALTKPSPGKVRVLATSGVLTPAEVEVEFTEIPPPVPTGIVLDDVVPTKLFASADGTYLNGWHYTFRITINNPNETNLFVKFSDWVNASSTSDKVAVLGNTRLLINEKGGAAAGVGITDELIVSGSGTIKSYALGSAYENQTLNGTTTAINLTEVDNNPDKAGRQVQFDVFTKLPPETVSGFYTTEFGIRTEIPPPAE
ncbi:MAG: tandem-95 repeat protein [Candidatus Taylorbacteria bacterium]|nr:tandem-95 repeat protein [Candidatus Taylorbacteria bacterium]